MWLKILCSSLVRRSYQTFTGSELNCYLRMKFLASNKLFLPCNIALYSVLWCKFMAGKSIIEAPFLC